LIRSEVDRHHAGRKRSYEHVDAGLSLLEHGTVPVAHEHRARSVVDELVTGRDIRENERI